MAGGKSGKAASTPYKGVWRKWGRYAAEIRKPGQKRRVWLGTFDTAEEAACAYDTASRDFYGPNAFVNLPENAPGACEAPLPLPPSAANNATTLPAPDQKPLESSSTPAHMECLPKSEEYMDEFYEWLKKKEFNDSA